MTSYHAFGKLAKLLPADVHGVRMRTANFFFDMPLEDDTEQWKKMEEIRAAEVSRTTAKLPDPLMLILSSHTDLTCLRPFRSSSDPWI